MTQHIWLNDKFILREDASISIEDRGYLIGHGVFDTMCAQEGTLIDPERHYQRLLQNADVMHLPHPKNLSFNEFVDIAEQLIDKNDLHPSLIVSIRSTISGGKGERGIILPKNPTPNFLMTATAVDMKLPLKPAKLIISSIKRNESSPLSQIKSTNYGDHILAREEAAQKKADDALMLNNQGDVCCTTIANVFFIDKNEQIFTPPLSDGVLAGTYRDKLIKKGQIIERSIHVDELQNYTSCFITNSLIGIREVSSIDAINYRLN